MMKIISVMNQKGGIGKTMTAASIAYILGEERQRRVLCVDADQQGNLSMLYDSFDPEGAGMPELLERHRSTGGSYSTADLIRTTPYEHIDIIPANGYLMRTNMNLLLKERDDQIARFTAAMLDGHDSDERPDRVGSGDHPGEGRRIRNRGHREHDRTDRRSSAPECRDPDEGADDHAPEESDIASGRRMAEDGVRV